MVENPEGDAVQVGIVSWGPECGAKVPGLYVKVSAVVDWINDVKDGRIKPASQEE